MLEWVIHLHRILADRCGEDGGDGGGCDVGVGRRRGRGTHREGATEKFSSLDVVEDLALYHVRIDVKALLPHGGQPHMLVYISLYGARVTMELQSNVNTI
jgi:hypothetical protein